MKKFRCCEPDVDPEYFTDIESIDAQFAAEEYAEQCWRDDGYEGTERLIVVHDADGNETRWKVTGEPTMAWHGEEQPEPGP